MKNDIKPNGVKESPSLACSPPLEPIALWCAFWAQYQKFPRLQIISLAIGFDAPEGRLDDDTRYLAVTVNFKNPRSNCPRVLSVPVPETRFGRSVESTLKTVLRELDRELFPQNAQDQTP